MNGPLAGWGIAVEGAGIEHDEARALLATFGASLTADGAPTVAVDAVDPDEAWAASGAMWLTGEEDGPPLAPAAPVAATVRGAAAVLRTLSSLLGTTVDVDGPALLGERAAIAGLERHGRRSAGGACRLLPAADGWVAANLARPGDWELVPAWLEDPRAVDDAGVAAAVATRPVSTVVERGQLLGLAVSELHRTPAPAAPFSIHRLGPARADGTAGIPGMRRRPLVLDFSSLWAGPLCAHLLGLAAARVVKVESTGRPDGARLGPPAFFDLLHGDHESVALDFGLDRDVAVLARLVDVADVVIEASRPRAFDQLGLDPAVILGRRPGLTWVTITGYGRTGPASNRIAYGDDGAVAGGLVAATAGGPVFCADAVADPLSGIYGAVGALAGLLGGGGVHVDVALRTVAAHAATAGGTSRSDGSSGGLARAAEPDDAGGWTLPTDHGAVPVARPRARTAPGAAPELGHHTAAILTELGIRR